MSILGLRGTGDFGADERPKNFRELILYKNPNGSAPLLALTSKGKKQSTDDPEFSWWEEYQTGVRIQHENASTGAGVTTLNLAAATAGKSLQEGGATAYDLVPGDLLMVEAATQAGITVTYDNEIVMVTSVTDIDTIEIARGVAGSTAATIAANVYLTKMGNAYSEGSDAPDVTSRNPTKYFNYTQIFKTAYELTETVMATKARTGNVLSNDKKRRSFDHSAALEYAMLLGKKHETVGANGKPLRFAGGLISFLVAASQAKIYSSTPTAATFMDDIYTVFNYTPPSGAGDERMILAGNAAINTINKIALADGTRQFMEEVKYYGMNLTKWRTPQGTFYIKSHPLFNVHPNLTKSAVILSPADIYYRPLRDTKAQDNIQENGADTKKGQWITEAGWEFHAMECMKFLGNLV